MIQITQLRLPLPHSPEGLRGRILKSLRIPERDLVSYHIVKKSLDARKKPRLFYIYTVRAEVRREARVLKKTKDKNITKAEQLPAYTLTPTGTKELPSRPVIIGTGPAGLFCGYQLAEMGYRPLLLERGASVRERRKDVEAFWQGGKLLADSNVQFGEGGAGTFSDGKLNTLVHDREGRNHEVLRLFAAHGAPEEILYDSRPHIGTDVLAEVVENLRESIIRMGGEVRFHTKVTDILTEHPAGAQEKRRLTGLALQNTRTGEKEQIPASLAVLAVGHSARDTFAMLGERDISMQAKAFAVGVRVEHPQKFIDRARYGADAPASLPAAAYKLAENLENGRGAYTFCMCPGGYVVNASSEEGRIAVNGMSYHARDGINANSAVIVTVTPEDFGGEDALAGIAFQRKLEENAWEAGKGKVPVQRFGDFKMNVASEGAGRIVPQIKGAYAWANVRSIFPETIAESLGHGIKAFGRKIAGYDQEDALLSGVESRTSSPVRILRDENLEGSVEGLYPCGEGAGYAGGITSAAMDGLKVAEAVSRIYRPFDKSKDGLRNF